MSSRVRCDMTHVKVRRRSSIYVNPTAILLCVQEKNERKKETEKETAKPNKEMIEERGRAGSSSCESRRARAPHALTPYLIAASCMTIRYREAINLHGRVFPMYMHRIAPAPSSEKPFPSIMNPVVASGMTMPVGAPPL